MFEKFSGVNGKIYFTLDVYIEEIV